MGIDRDGAAMDGKLRFGLFGLHRGTSADPEALVRRARLAEDAGFDSLWVGDHVALPIDNDQVSAAAREPRLEALVALAYLAAATRDVRLAVGVLVLPQRQPVLLAKQLASIDLLSRGRLIVGVGVGHLEQELRAFAVPLAERGMRADECLDAVLALWDEPTPSLSGRFVSVRGVIQRPRPVQRPHPPIVVGGASPAALKRAVQRGNGWHGWHMDLQQTTEALSGLQSAAAVEPRPAALGSLEITVTPSQVPDLKLARRYADLGVHRLAVQPDSSSETDVEELIQYVGDSLVGHV
jgi:probable F420-dependent oxidoreductase